MALHGIVDALVDVERKWKDGRYHQVFDHMEEALLPLVECDFVELRARWERRIDLRILSQLSKKREPFRPRLPVQPSLVFLEEALQLYFRPCLDNEIAVKQHLDVRPDDATRGPLGIPKLHVFFIVFVHILPKRRIMALDGLFLKM